MAQLHVIGLLVVSVLLMITSIMGYMSLKDDQTQSTKKKFMVGMMIISPLLIAGSVALIVRAPKSNTNATSPAPALPQAPAPPSPSPPPVVANLANKNKA